MGKQTRRGPKREKHLRVRSIRQDPPNLERLTNALLDMAMRQAATEQEAQAQRTRTVNESQLEASNDKS